MTKTRVIVDANLNFVVVPAIQHVSRNGNNIQFTLNGGAQVALEDDEDGTVWNQLDEFFAL
jgi:hypothetical protein